MGVPSIAAGEVCPGRNNQHAGQKNKCYDHGRLGPRGLFSIEDCRIREEHAEEITRARACRI